MGQPYLFKKQIFALLVVIIILILEKTNNANILFLKITLFYFIVILSITFVPSIRKKIKYPILLHNIIYYFPLIMPIFFIRINIEQINNIFAISIGVTSSIILSIVGYRVNKDFLSSKNLSTQLSITNKEFINNLFGSLLAIISEEIFFRYFLIGCLYIHIGIYSVYISTILFVYCHYINRWADKMFNIKSYLYQFFTGIVLGFIFYYTGSIIGCITCIGGHIMINVSDFIILFKQLKNRSKCKQQLFNDY